MLYYVELYGKINEKQVKTTIQRKIINTTLGGYV
jgi:hypothetical protein